MALPDDLLLWLAVVLAAVELTLAALAIGVALIAVVGRRAVLAVARQEARRAAEEEARARLADYNLRDMVVRAVQAEGDKLFRDMQMAGQAVLNDAGEEKA